MRSRRRRRAGDLTDGPRAAIIGRLPSHAGRPRRSLWKDRAVSIPVNVDNFVRAETGRMFRDLQTRSSTIREALSSFRSGSEPDTSRDSAVGRRR
jgi:hypothetical protein